MKKTSRKDITNRKDKEYSKQMLSRILGHSVAMMWCSYILAWFEKTEIAESLSTTIATVIIGVTIPYFITKSIENVSKYGSRLNGTTVEQEVKTEPAELSEDLNKMRDC